MDPAAEDSNREMKVTNRQILWAIVLVPLLSACDNSHEFGPEDAIRRFKRLSLDSVDFVEIESEENSFHNGADTFSRIAYVDDIWLLRQRDVIDDIWQIGAILVKDDIAYFSQLGQYPKLIAQACTSCHPNGPRLLRGRLVSGDPGVVKSYNEAIQKSGLIRAFEPPNEPAILDESLEIEACTACHNNKDRSNLTSFNEETVYFLVSRNYMPPDEPLSDEDRKAIYRWGERIE